MTFFDAVISVLVQYARFSGRARRSEYWWFALFYLVAGIVAAVLDANLLAGTTWAGNGPITVVLTVVLFLPSLTVSVRRLHDTDRSGWWILLGLVPLVGFVAIIIFAVQSGTPGTNRFGPDPTNPAAAYRG